MAKKSTVPQWITDEVSKFKTDPMNYLQSKFGQTITCIWKNQYGDHNQGYIATGCQRMYKAVYTSAPAPDTDGKLYISDTRYLGITTYIYDMIFGFIDNLQMYTVKTSFSFSEVPSGGQTSRYVYNFKDIVVEEPKLCRRVDRPVNIIHSSRYQSAREQFEADFPYAITIADVLEAPAELFYVSPQIEQLYKAGYIKLVSDFIRAFKTNSKSEMDVFYRLTQPGKDMKSIFKTEKAVYKGLKDEGASLKMWDVCRRMVKTGKLNADSIMMFAQMDLREKEFDKFYSILNKTYKDKPVFTFQTLVNYLNRVDTYEALEYTISLQILDDYLQSCKYLGIRPNVESDSLMREHNVAARLCRQKRREEYDEGMKKACEDLQKLDYEEGAFFIRGIFNYDDLFDEATQQSNCLTCYTHQILNRQKLIYVMRRKACPEKSLITVELSPDGKTIRQKLLAWNQPIRNSSQQEFLQHWLKWIASNQKGLWDKISQAVDNHSTGLANDVIYAAKCKAMDLYVKSGDLDASVQDAIQTMTATAA